MKRKNALPVLACLLMGCAASCSTSSSLTEDKVYLKFQSTIMNRNVDQDCDVICTLFDDHEAKFSILEDSFRWKENDGYGLTISSEEHDVFVDFDRYSATHYFFCEIDGTTYRFEAKDTTYVQNLSSDYSPAYQRLGAYEFSGHGTTSGVETTGKVFLLDDESRTVYVFPQGPDGRSTNVVFVSYGWTFSNGVYSVPFGGENILSSHCDIPGKRGYRLQIPGVGISYSNYYLVEDEGFDWRNYQDSDFQIETGK